MKSLMERLLTDCRVYATGEPLPHSRSAMGVLAFVVVVGIAARLSPLTDPVERLFWQYITEDGYLMQTVARNMAIGLGMSTAEGTIPTNGVQPLATYLFAMLHWLAGGDKLQGIGFVMVLSTLISAASAYLLYCVASLLFARLRGGRQLAIAAAGLWFAAPYVIPHTMNGLETGLYHAAVLACLLYHLRIGQSGAPLAASQRLVLGMLLGLAFLARNDAVFFIAALLLAHLIAGGSNQGGVRRRLIDCIVAGITSILIATPWLIYNYASFGSIVPISGSAQSHGTAFATNLPLVAANLFESAFIFLLIPGRIEAMLPVIFFCAVALLLVLAVFWYAVGSESVVTQRFYLTGVLFMLALVLYYGHFFGAAWFLPRYFSVLSPVLWLAVVVSAYLALSILFRVGDSLRIAVGLVLVLSLCASLLFAARDYVMGPKHMHRQVIAWVSENVPGNVWVGAPQTGTMGYFHDRTINLDGKVNPIALQVLRTEGHVLNYVAHSEIDYIADWVGIADWVQMEMSPEFSRLFEVVVRDEARNLGALRRKGAPSR